jgi:hypothetical protein
MLELRVKDQHAVAAALMEKKSKDMEKTGFEFKHTNQLCCDTLTTHHV